ncbi:hypothetical protein [Ferruginibacter sp.]|nr:hypothetical protein [Ferruginibacter sp.]
MISPNLISREKKLNTELNNFLCNLTGENIDYVTKLNSNNFIELKRVLQDINNILTLKLSFKFIDELQRHFNFSEEWNSRNKEKIDRVNPNTKGFDIKIDTPIKIIAEIKCNVPCNSNGTRFEAAQKREIFKDAHKLMHKTLDETKEYFKFLVLLDNNNLNGAVTALLNYKAQKTNQERENRMLVKDLMKVFENTFKLDELSTNFIYIYKLSL